MVLSKRELNVIYRRKRITTSARALIKSGGVDAMNMRALAALADITVPTIYKLVGNKNAVIELLLTELLTPLMKSPYYDHSSNRDPIAIAKDACSTLRSIYSVDESLFRELFRSINQHGPIGGGFTKTAMNQFCQNLANDGYLEGNFPTDMLAESISNTFTKARRLWFLNELSLEDMEHKILEGIFVALVADATPTLRARLAEEVKQRNES